MLITLMKFQMSLFLWVNKIIVWLITLASKKWRTQNESPVNNFQITLILKILSNDFNAKFVHIDTFKTDKSIVEDQFLHLLKEYEIDLVVLAKYMQILSDSF